LTRFPTCRQQIEEEISVSTIPLGSIEITWKGLVSKGGDISFSTKHDIFMPYTLELKDLKVIN
jgi:hypothetical protein